MLYNVIWEKFAWSHGHIVLSCVMTFHLYFLLLYILCIFYHPEDDKVEDEMSSLIHSLYINKPTNLETDLSMKNKLE